MRRFVTGLVLIHELLPNLPCLPEMTALVGEDQIKRKSQGIPDPRIERGLHLGIPQV